MDQKQQFAKERWFFRQCFITFLIIRSLHVSLALGSFAFELYDLGHAIWMWFHKLLTIVCRNFGPFLLTELVSLSCLYEAPWLFVGERSFSLCSTGPFWLPTSAQTVSLSFRRIDLHILDQIRLISGTQNPSPWAVWWLDIGHGWCLYLRITVVTDELSVNLLEASKDMISSSGLSKVF